MKAILRLCNARQFVSSIIPHVDQYWDAFQTLREATAAALEDWQSPTPWAALGEILREAKLQHALHAATQEDPGDNPMDVAITTLLSMADAAARGDDETWRALVKIAGGMPSTLREMQLPHVRQIACSDLLSLWSRENVNLHRELVERALGEHELAPEEFDAVRRSQGLRTLGGGAGRRGLDALANYLRRHLPRIDDDDDGQNAEFNQGLQGDGNSDAPNAAPKRSTERGEGRARLIAALTKHHQYADGGCLNLDPIGNNRLARVAGVSVSTASAFFNDKFQGHTKYKALCRDAGKLVAAMKLLNDEFAPYHLLGDSCSNLAAPDRDEPDWQ